MNASIILVPGDFLANPNIYVKRLQEKRLRELMKS